MALSNKPTTDEHVAGQTPAAETDQATYEPPDDLTEALNAAQNALNSVDHNQSRPDPSDDQVDDLVEKLEEAAKQVKAHKRRRNSSKKEKN